MLALVLVVLEELQHKNSTKNLTFLLFYQFALLNIHLLLQHIYFFLNLNISYMNKLSILINCKYSNLKKLNCIHYINCCFHSIQLGIHQHKSLLLDQNNYLHILYNFLNYQKRNYLNIHHTLRNLHIVYNYLNMLCNLYKLSHCLWIYLNEKKKWNISILFKNKYTNSWTFSYTLKVFQIFIYYK